MSAPIIFISHKRVKEGMLDAFMQYYPEAIEELKADKPGTLVHLAYASEDGRQLTVVQVLSDADAMDALMQGAGERSKRMYEFTVTERLEIYGTPNPGVLEMMRKIAGSGVPLIYNPHFMDGYYHLSSG